MVVAPLTVTRRPRVWGSTLWVLTRLTRGAYSLKLTAGENALTRLVWRLAYERELANARNNVST